MAHLDRTSILSPAIVGPAIGATFRKLDPRQYDPRRIIRDALLEPPEPRRREPDLEPEPEPVRNPAPKARPQLATFDEEAT